MPKVSAPKILLIIICVILQHCGLNKTTPASKEETTRKLSIVQKLKEQPDLPIEEQIRLYFQLKKKNPEAYNFNNETELTLYGYGYLWNNKFHEAIAIFKLIVEEFPNSSNAYDSLAEAYLKAGNNELAIINYQKSLELDPNNFNAEDQLEFIKNPQKRLDKPADKFNKRYTINEYKADMDQMAEKLMEIHPNALKFTTKKELLAIVEQKKELLTDTTTFADFVWHCNEIIAAVHCSHTSLGGFYSEREMLPSKWRFPLHTRWVNNQLFVIDPLSNQGQIKTKDEIISINGKAVPDIVQDVYKHIVSQGYIQTTKQHFFNQWSTSILAYALGFPTTYNVRIKGKNQSVLLTTEKTIQEPYYDPTVNFCNEGLCFEILKDGKTALLTVSSFVYYPWDNLNVFEKFMDNTFDTIQKLDIQNLIIDVRQNRGGSPESSIYLLRYLVNKPFTYYSRVETAFKTQPAYGEQKVNPFKNRFKGKLYFMIDGLGNSTTGHFMSMVKSLKLGTIVGEELGSNQFCSAGQTICRLKHTKLVYYIADNTNVTTATNLPDEKGILPDYYVAQTIEEYLNNVDAVKEFTLKLIQQKK